MTDIRDHAQFLCDRLDEIDFSQRKSDIERDYYGHVVPALARLKDEIAAFAAERPGVGEEITDRVYRVLRDFYVTNMADEDGRTGFPLVDLVSNEPPADISTGEEQLRDLASEIAEALSAPPIPATCGGELRPEAFTPMDQWDKRDEAVLLLIDYSDGDHPLDDATVAITIGHNNDHNVGDGEGEGWLFAGWCWTHDHYVQGKGTPIGWMPIPHHLAALSPTPVAGGK